MGAVRVCWTLALYAVSAVAQSPGVFTQTGDMTAPRYGHTATLLPNGKVLIAGGVDLYRAPMSRWASAEIYDPSTGSFTPTGNMTAARQGHTATLLPTGQVLIAGGNLNGGGSSSAELYDPATGTFSATGSMTASRGGHTATLLNSGKVLMVGGWYPPNANGAPTYQPAELFEPGTGTFTATADLMEPLVNTATLLPDGKVLVTAPIFYGGASHAYLYDPALEVFTRVSDLADYSLGAMPAATLLTSGKVLFAGGDLAEDGGSASADIFDPVAAAFSNIAKMSTTMRVATATLLPDGTVLIAGGDDVTRCSKDLNHCSTPPETPPGTAELYDPITATFAVAGSSHSEQGHADTLLADGSVLLSGGYFCCGRSITNAEIYHPPVQLPSPLLFSVSSSLQGAILHASTQQLVSAGAPAVAGEAIEIYGTGLIDGAVISPLVVIGGLPAEVLYFGAAPGYPGLNQINVRVPNGILSGPSVPVRLDYLGRPSNEVTLAVR